MSILIKGLNMPTDEGIILAIYDSKAKQIGTEKEYEAVEVPPHGRLIDADALKELIASHVYVVSDCINSRDYGMFWTGGIEKAIDEQPTIIEAEREE